MRIAPEWPAKRIPVLASAIELNAQAVLWSNRTGMGDTVPLDPEAKTLPRQAVDEACAALRKAIRV
jgi:hypothetical protein